MNIKPDTVIADRYRIIEKIGVGGMAVVYRAKDEKLDRSVTFKVLKEEFITDEEFIKKFNVEACAAAKLSHNNIVNVYDVGNEGDIYYIVMEYIDGITLKELILKKAPFDNNEALSIAIQIASALEVAHRKNIVHRDIKPQNILVTKEGIVKVTDFGIARAVTSTTVTAESVGSVHYFSPEQARGGFVDTKSDIYSLGIVIYEMVTGRLPFDGETPVALAMKHLREPLPDMLQFNPDITESVELIILKATQKSASKRYQSIEEMNRDLKIATNNTSGDFVKMEADVDTSSQTIVITPKEMKEIKNQYDNYEENFNDDYNEDYTHEPKRNLKSRSREEYEKRSERRVVIAAIVTAIAIIALISSVGAFFITYDNSEMKTVPDFKGKTWEEALELAKETELYIKASQEEEYSDDYEKDLIMAQSLEAGSKTKAGSTVEITLSKGTNKFKLPDVVGKDADSANEELKGVKIKQEYETSDSYEKDIIMRQEPEGGETVAYGDTVTLYISLGEEEELIEVPNVINESQDYARITLENEKFIVKREYQHSDTVKEGNIISQSPKAGTQLSEGSAVLIVVSNGPDKKEPETEEATKAQAEGEANQAKGDTQKKEMQYDTLVISPNLTSAEGNVSVKVVDVTNGITIYDNISNVNDFPLSISVQGKSPTSYQLYIDGTLVATETKFQ